jgi:hypothetical protein
VAFALNLDYFNTFKEDFRITMVNMREGKVLSHKPRSVRKSLETVFYQSLISPDRGSSGRGGTSAGSTGIV